MPFLGRDVRMGLFMHLITVYAGVADEEKSTRIHHHHELDTWNVLMYCTHDIQAIFMIQH